MQKGIGKPNFLALGFTFPFFAKRITPLISPPKRRTMLLIYIHRSKIIIPAILPYIILYFPKFSMYLEKRLESTNQKKVEKIVPGNTSLYKSFRLGIYLYKKSNTTKMVVIIMICLNVFHTLLTEWLKPK